jgi:hypothetical protein
MQGRYNYVADGLLSMAWHAGLIENNLIERRKFNLPAKPL